MGASCFIGRCKSTEPRNTTNHILVKNGCSIDPYEYWLWDGIHPTEPMHGFLAELWLKAVADIL